MWKIALTLVLMVACGLAAFVTTLLVFMELGTKLHGNYEYYGNFATMILLYIVAAIGFSAPGIVSWYLHKNGFPRQFSLRSLLIAMGLIAVVLGIGVSFFTWLG